MLVAQKKRLLSAGASFAAIALCLACGSSGPNVHNANRPILTLPNDNVEIYVAGSVTEEPTPPKIHPPMHGSYPVVWTKDSQTLLDEKALGEWGSTANAVFVAGDDVYLAGVDNTQLRYGHPDPAPAVWKNGEKTLLGLSENNCNGGNVTSVFVSGDDVYVGGYQFLEVETWADQGAWSFGEGNNRATLWKNGDPTLLETPACFDSFVSSVFVDGEDVYAAGGFSRMLKWRDNEYYNFEFAAVWKNGEVVFGDVDGSCSFAMSVSVSNGIVYVAGDVWEITGEREINGGYGNHSAVLWIDGEPQYLNSADNRMYSSGATSVFVSGDDVYIVGSESVSEENAEVRYRAILWKNGEKTILPDNFIKGTGYSWDYHALPLSLCVVGDDVYVVGEERTALGKKDAYGDDAFGWEAVLWVNGERHSLCQGDYPRSTANSIFVRATR